MYRDNGNIKVHVSGLRYVLEVDTARHKIRCNEYIDVSIHEISHGLITFRLKKKQVTLIAVQSELVVLVTEIVTLSLEPCMHWQITLFLHKSTDRASARVFSLQKITTFSPGFLEHRNFNS